MATISLIVRSTEKGQPATIYLRYRDGRDTQIWVTTPERINPEYWSNHSQEFKQRILFNDVFTEKRKAEIEQKFNQLKDFITNERFKLHGNQVTKVWLKSTVDKFYNKRESGSETLFQYIQRFIDEATAGTRLNRGKHYTASTIKNYKGFQVQLNEFCGIYTDETKAKLLKKGESLRSVKVLNFEDITIDFYNEYLNFFNDKNYSPNTSGRHIKQLKVIMRQAREEGLHNNTEFQRKSFEAMAVKVDNTYLNEAELKKLFDLNLSENKNHEIARDVFLCGCYTSQRYSDYSRISKEMIKEYSGIKVIELVQQKTGERCIIPIRPELRYILEKYDYSLPKTHEQKVNKAIKKVCEKAEINEKVYIESYEGGLKVKKSVHKYELIKTHTARRSGCTNMYLAGIPTIDIMKISSHKTEREFQKYIKVTKQETAMSLSIHPYFIGNILSIAK